MRVCRNWNASESDSKQQNFERHTEGEDGEEEGRREGEEGEGEKTIL